MRANLRYLRRFVLRGLSEMLRISIFLAMCIVLFAMATGDQINALALLALSIMWSSLIIGQGLRDSRTIVYIDQNYAAGWASTKTSSTGEIKDA